MTKYLFAVLLIPPAPEAGVYVFYGDQELTIECCGKKTCHEWSSKKRKVPEAYSILMHSAEEELFCVFDLNPR